MHCFEEGRNQRSSDLEQAINAFRSLRDAHWTHGMSVETASERRFLCFVAGVVKGLELAAQLRADR
jgi:hypothetical protein